MQFVYGCLSDEKMKCKAVSLRFCTTLIQMLKSTILIKQKIIGSGNWVEPTHLRRWYRYIIIDVVLETRVLVSRRLEDKNESLGLGLGLGS